MAFSELLRTFPFLSNCLEAFTTELPVPTDFVERVCSKGMALRRGRNRKRGGTAPHLRRPWQGDL